MNWPDRELGWLIIGTFMALGCASLVGLILRWRCGATKTIENLNSRIMAWWFMILVFLGAVLSGPIVVVVLFGLLSLLALREFLTLTPTRLGDHRALFWAFFVVLPIQYIILGIHWYAFFSIFIPVYVYLILPIRSAAAGDVQNFLTRTAIIQWGLMICVYCLSHGPALLTMLEIPGYPTRDGKLLCYLVLVCEASDVLQYVCGKLFGKHPVAPKVSPSKTWEGLIGGVALTVGLGTALWWVTPFSPQAAAGMSLTICLAGFGGGLVMSAIKRDRGVKDWGHAIAGHGGILDRLDSFCFAAPFFFHFTRYFYSTI